MTTHTYDSSFKKEVASTISAQLGNQYVMMIGAYNLIYGELKYKEFVQPYFQFSFKARAKDNIKICRIIYNVGADTYIMQFLKKDGTVVKEIDPTYCDELIYNFEETTGLYICM